MQIEGKYCIGIQTLELYVYDLSLKTSNDKNGGQQSHSLACMTAATPTFQIARDHWATHHHELASTTSSWELQARKAAASSRCRSAPVRLLRTGLLSMVRCVAASQPVLGDALCCWDMGRKSGGVALSPAGSLGLHP